MNGLTNTQQAIIMLIAFLLPPIGVWMGLGFPVDRVALGILGVVDSFRYHRFHKGILRWNTTDTLIFFRV